MAAEAERVARIEPLTVTLGTDAADLDGTRLATEFLTTQGASSDVLTRWDLYAPNAVCIGDRSRETAATHSRNVCNRGTWGKAKMETDPRKTCHCGPRFAAHKRSAGDMDRAIRLAGRARTGKAWAKHLRRKGKRAASKAVRRARRTCIY